MKLNIYRAILALQKGDTVLHFKGTRYYLSPLEAEEDNVLFLRDSPHIEGVLETVRKEILIPEVNKKTPPFPTLSF